MSRFPIHYSRAQGAALAVALALTAVVGSTASAGPCIGCFGVVTVGRSGLGANCSTASLQDAINKAKLPEWADEVWVTNDVLNGEYRVGTVNIDNQDVTIIGGFDDCLDATPGGFTTISGAGGQTNSVFTIRGTSNVTMQGLVVTGGDDDPDSDGGGIDFKGNGSLTLTKMRIIENVAGYGGGILAGTDAFSLVVNVLDDVLIADNTAYVNGGGIHVLGATLNVTGNGVGIHRNRAVGVNGSQGRGGGIYLKIPADAEISATGFTLFNEFPVFYANRARQGGAIAAVGADNFNGAAYVRISPGVLGGPFVFQDNQADVEGGALFSGATSVGVTINTSSSGWFCAYDTAFRGNTAPDGAAIYYDSAQSITDNNEQGYLSINGGPGCGGPPVRRCPAGNACNEFSGNRTVRADNGARTNGAVAEFEGSVGRFENRGAVFKDNIAGSLVHFGDGLDGSLLQLLNCVMVMNDLSGPAVDSDADETMLRHCTIADNALGGEFVLRIVESAATGNEHVASITNSIIAQPGKTSLDLGGAADQTLIRYVLASEIASLRAGASGGTVFIGNPAFENPTLGDYRPRDNAIAVDYAPAVFPDGTFDGFVFDVLRNPRSVDLPQMNFSGERDLGAYERQTARPDLLFANGFENP